MVKRSNQTLEVLRFIAACMIVFIHIKFPDELGWRVRALARFGVPFFFMVSGYFCFGQGEQSIRRRLKKTVILILVANGLYMIGLLMAGYTLEVLAGWVFGVQGFARMVFYSVSALGGPLWYLNAIAGCYLFLWGYLCLFRDRATPPTGPLYALIPTLLGLFLALDRLKIRLSDAFDNTLYRNWLLFGLPFVLLGMAVHQHQERILAHPWLKGWRLPFWAVAGLALSLIEQEGQGNLELPLGSMLTALTMLLFALRQPVLIDWRPAWALARFCGQISLPVYVLHRLVYHFIDTWQNEVDLFGWMIRHNYKLPVLVLLISLALGLVWLAVQALLGRIRAAVCERMEGG